MPADRPKMMDTAGRKARRAVLEQIGGLWPWEVEDLSVGGRTAVLRVLEQHAAAQLKIRVGAPEYYSEKFHVLILKAVSAERKAIAEMTAGIPRPHTQLKMRLVK
jgi:hypothetical protein